MGGVLSSDGTSSGNRPAEVVPTLDEMLEMNCQIRDIDIESYDSSGGEEEAEEEEEDDSGDTAQDDNDSKEPEQAKRKETADEKSAKCQTIRNEYFVKYTDDPKRLEAFGPTPRRTQDFWHMIIEKRIPNIVMLGDFFDQQGKRQCGQYVPEADKRKQQCGIYTVKRFDVRTRINDWLTYEKLIVYQTDDPDRHKHCVIHFHMREFDDFGKPNAQRRMSYCHIVMMLGKTDDPLVVMHEKMYDEEEELDELFRGRNRKAEKSG